MVSTETVGLVSHQKKANFNISTAPSMSSATNASAPITKTKQLHVQTSAISAQRLAAFGLENEMSVEMDSRAMASMSNETADFTGKMVPVRVRLKTHDEEYLIDKNKILLRITIEIIIGKKLK